MTSYESVCEELDALTINYLTTISEYKQQWETASELFQKGYLDLSHAKYAMGSRTISHYSYDERMKANVKIEYDQALHVKKVTEKVEEEEEEEEEKEDKKGHGYNLRKRNIKKKEEEEEKEKPDDNRDKKDKKKKKKSDNPLHWFGLFVSPSLRSSQESFIKALPLLVEQVNKVKELEEMEKKYNELLETKLALKLKNTTLQDVTTTTV